MDIPAQNKVKVVTAQLLTNCPNTVRNIHTNVTENNLGWFLTLCTNSYLYIYIIHLLKSSTCFEHYSGHLQEVYVVIIYTYGASGIVTVCRWLSCTPVRKELFPNRCKGQSPADYDDIRGCIYTVTTKTPWKWAGKYSKHVEDFNKCIIYK